MNKSTKLILGLATLWPIIYMGLFFLYTFLSIFQISSFSNVPTNDGIPSGMIVILKLHFFTMIWIFGLLVFYIINVFKSNRVSSDKKVLWVVVLLFCNMLSMPFYWYSYIWKEPNEKLDVSQRE